MSSGVARIRATPLFVDDSGSSPVLTLAGPSPVNATNSSAALRRTAWQTASLHEGPLRAYPAETASGALATSEHLDELKM